MVGALSAMQGAQAVISGWSEVYCVAWRLLSYGWKGRIGRDIHLDLVVLI